MNTVVLDHEARSRRDARGDRLFSLAMGSCAALVLLLLAGVAGGTLVGGWPAFHAFGLDFFTRAVWDPNAIEFGALVPVFGTLATSIIAMLIAVPVSLGIAVFLSEVSPPWLRTPLAAALELLAGIPSIIYGMWGLFVLGPWLGENAYPWINDNLGELPVVGPLFQGPPLGIGLLTAGVVLAIMVIPFISSVMREVFLTVPSRLKESAYALGSTTWEVVWHVVLPYTKSAVVGGIFLGLGRALGETMAVTFVIGNAYDLTPGLLNPGTSIASTIANEFGEAVDPMHKSSLMALGFLLFVLTFVVLALAKWLLMRLQRREGE